MKKMLKKVFALCLSFCILFAIGTPAIAAYSSDNLPQILDQEQFFTLESKPLSSYACQSSTTIDGMKIAAFFDESGNIVASMAEDSHTLVVRFADGRKFVFDKNSNGALNSSHVTESFVNTINLDSNSDTSSVSTITPNAASIENYTSKYFGNDKYTHYESLDTWHLYYDNDYAYSGDNASSTILSQCESFKTHLRAMDGYLDEAAESLLGLIPGYALADALGSLVNNPSWGNAAELVAEIILMFPNLSAVGDALTAGSLFVNVSYAVGEHSSYVHAFNYVKENA